MGQDLGQLWTTGPTQASSSGLLTTTLGSFFTPEDRSILSLNIYVILEVETCLLESCKKPWRVA